MVEDILDGLIQEDDGRDQDIKASDVDEFKITSDERIITFLYPNHRKVDLGKFKKPDGFSYRVWLTPEIKEWIKGEGKAYIDVEPRWFNAIFDYSVNPMERPIKPQIPVVGRTLFFQFTKTKYMDLREIFQENFDEEHDLTNLQVKVSLDGEEKFQKMKFSKANPKGKLFTHLGMYALAEMANLLKNDSDEGKEQVEKFSITEELVEKIKSEYGYLPTKYNKHSPLMTLLEKTTKEIMGRVTAYSKFARVKTVAQLKEEISGSTAVSNQVKKAEENESSIDDMEDMLN